MILEITLQSVATIGAALLTWLLGTVIRKIMREDFDVQVAEAIKVGVDQTQEEFVIWAKRAAADGKLTKEERQQAMELARTTAMKYANNKQVRQYIFTMSKEVLNSWVKRLLS